ncbi:MAG: hypothetical protein ACI85U_002829, partial [Candidatus Promineifilaceae bacterium]
KGVRPVLNRLTPFSFVTLRPSSAHRFDIRLIMLFHLAFPSCLTTVYSIAEIKVSGI